MTKKVKILAVILALATLLCGMTAFAAVPPTAETQASGNYSFTFYISNGTVTQYSNMVKKSASSSAATVTPSSVGGSYSSIQMYVMFCGETTAMPMLQATGKYASGSGTMKLPYTSTYVSKTGYYRLYGQGSYIEAMSAGTWTP